jgi:hypothetical protein
MSGAFIQRTGETQRVERRRERSDGEHSREGDQSETNDHPGEHASTARLDVSEIDLGTYDDHGRTRAADPSPTQPSFSHLDVQA